VDSALLSSVNLIETTTCSRDGRKEYSVSGPPDLSDGLRVGVSTKGCVGVQSRRKERLPRTPIKDRDNHQFNYPNDRIYQHPKPDTQLKKREISFPEERTQKNHQEPP
jgi:hypothetical protein